MTIRAEPEAAGGATRALAWLLLAPIVALAATRELWAPDEPRYAEIARELVERGDFIVLHLNGELYPDKPPLVYWLAALGGWVSGWSELALRLPSIVATAGSAWLCARFARRLWGEREALWAVAFYLGTAMVVWLGGRLALDPLLSFFCLASVYLATAANEVNEAPLASRAAARNLALAGLCAGLGALAKGPIAWLHVGSALLAWRFLPARLRARFPSSRAGWTAFGVLAVLPVVLWATAASLKEPALWKPLFFGQHLGRVAEGEAHRRPFWYHLQNQALLLLPWTVLFAAALARAWRAWRDWRAEHAGRGDADASLVRMAAWLGLLFVFFSAIPTKRELYLLPMYPAAALLCARELALGERRGRLPALVSHAGVVVLVVAGLALLIGPWIPDRTSGDPSTFGEALGSEGILALMTAGTILLLAAAWAAHALRRGRVGSWAATVFAGLGAAELAIAIVVVPAANPRLSARDLALWLAARPERPATIPCQGVRPEGYRFYGRVPAVKGDLAAALERDRADFLGLVSRKDLEKLAPEVRARFRLIQAQSVGSRDVLVVGSAAPR